MSDHEKEIEIEGTELQRLREITVVNEDRACANKGNWPLSLVRFV